MARPKKMNGTALARPGDPLVLSDGSTIEEEVEKPDPVPHEQINARTFRSSKRRSVQELPAPVKTVNVISVVLMYTLMGLSDREIAEALDVKIAQIKEIRDHSAYVECFDCVLNELLSANSDLLQSRISAHASMALDGVISIARDGKQENNRLRASQDILDRAGARPQDNVNKRAQTMNELRIVIVDGDKKLDVNLNGQDL